MKKLKNLYLIIVSVAYFTTTNVYSSVPLGSGSITFVGSVVESTCKSSSSGLICGEERILTYTDLASTNDINHVENTSMKIQLISKVTINDTTLLATILYH